MKNKMIQSFLLNELDRVDKWLSFGEAKNAALIAFNVAALSVNMDFRCLLLLALVRILMVFSILISLASFWPNLAKQVDGIQSKPPSNCYETNNYLYFGDIALLNNGNEYLQIIMSRYLTKESNIINTYYLDLAEEIVINSRIAVKKYKYFKYSLMIDFMAIIFTGVIFICG